VWLCPATEFINFNMYPATPHRRFRALSVAAVQVCCLVLSGCEKASDRAQREYDMMVRAHASAEARCAKKHEIAEAFLKEENEQEYQLTDVEADVECNRASLDRLSGASGDSTVTNDIIEIDRAGKQNVPEANGSTNKNVVTSNGNE
jgi:hypothetical protein